MRNISVLLAEDHAIVREGLRRLLELDPDLEVVGEAQDGRQALALVGRLRPRVVLMDLAMPLLNGLEATRQIARTLPGTKVLILSAHNEEAYATGAAEAGAAGFLRKQSSVHEVCSAIRTVLQGGDFHCPAFPKRPAGGWAAGKTVHLTPRESEVLQLIAEGKANKETAALLGIAIKTVEKHREHLMAKLGIHDTAGLTRYAIGAGIIESCIQTTVL